MKSKVPPIFKSMIEVLTVNPFDESSVTQDTQGSLDQGVNNDEFGSSDLEFTLSRVLGHPVFVLLIVVYMAWNFRISYSLTLISPIRIFPTLED